MHLVGVDEGSSNQIAFQVGVVGRHRIIGKRGCIAITKSERYQRYPPYEVTYLWQGLGLSGAEQRCWRSYWRHLEQK
jgi:hypothetical protein